MNIQLWFIKESPTGKARYYSRIPASRGPVETDKVWVPRSVISHTTKQPAKPGEAWPEHHMQIEDWFAEREIFKSKQ